MHTSCLSETSRKCLGVEELSFNVHQHISEVVMLVFLLLENDEVVFLITSIGYLVYGAVYRILKSMASSSQVFPVL